LLDTITGADTITFTPSTPHTYMGDGWTNNTIPVGSTSVQITGLTLYMMSTTTQAYTDVVARIQFWSNYNAGATPVFTNGSGPLITVDLGPQSLTANTFTAIPVTLATPLILPGGPGMNWGFAQNFQGNTGAGLVDTTSLTSMITARSNGQYSTGQITTGTAPEFGYYRNASGRVDFNFGSTDRRMLTELNAQGIGIVIFGTAQGGGTPTPSPTPPLPTPTAAATATPDATVTPTPTPTPAPTPARALNISTRLRVETGDRVMIGGFIITGSGPKRVVLRGIGPSLANFGIADALADPVLDLRDSSGVLLVQNDNWQDNATDQGAQLSALGLAPPHPNESGMVAVLPSQTSYTAILAGKNGGTGVGLVEVYDIDEGADSQLANISTRGFVQTGDNVMIGGFILGGSNGSTDVAVRGIGPSLAQFGLSNVLADPTLELRDSNGVLLTANDNWQNDPVSAAQLTRLGLSPHDPLESGIFATLVPGAFTAILAGNNAGVGVGLVEIYNVH
jgi:hypothetical protein